jgi:hypothetical protein
MTDNGELHVIFGTGAVRISVMDELIRRGRRRVRMVNRSGRARVPHGVEVVGGDVTDEAFARGPAREHRSSTLPSTHPTTSGPSCSPHCKRACWRERRAPGRSS